MSNLSDNHATSSNSTSSSGDMPGLLPLVPPQFLPAEGEPLIIAGPCSAESREQTLTTARALADSGVKIFRAGAWKPRTRPGGFEGRGAEALKWLAEVNRQTGMYVTTEVANREHTLRALEAGVRLLWIGARTSANPFAMQEIADTIAAQGADVAVMVKNPVSPEIDLWIGALMRLYNAGVRRLGAIHRGFNAYGQHIYRNMPQWAIPIELRRRYPRLPILCDPSHMGGNRNLVATLSQQALDIGFDGLFIESHCNPDAALSDAAQQITPAGLRLLLNNLVIRSRGELSGELVSLRRQIDDIDNELLEILSRRMEVCRNIGRYKKAHDMPAVQIDRHDEIMRKRALTASQLGMSPDFIHRILSAIHAESVRQQLEILTPPHK